MIHLESTEHGYIRNLKSQSYKQMSTLSLKESVGLGIRGYERPGFYFQGGGGNFSLDFKMFSMALLPCLCIKKRNYGH